MSPLELGEVLAQFFMYTVEPLLERQRRKTDLRLMAASIYGGYTAYHSKPDDPIQDNRRMERSILAAKALLDRID